MCGGMIPAGYAFCPTRGQPVVAPAPVAPAPLAANRIVLLFFNATLVIVLAVHGLLTVVAPPSSSTSPAAPTATMTLSPTSAATTDARITPTTLGTAAPYKHGDRDLHPSDRLAADRHAYGNPGRSYVNSNANTERITDIMSDGAKRGLVVRHRRAGDSADGLACGARDPPLV